MQEMSISSVPTSLFRGANVIPDVIVLQDDEFDVLDALLMIELVGSGINVQSAELRHYRYEKV